MTQSNHITGGTVFTGIFASLWDINIFSDINMLIVCWFASLLPDIDHTKSPIGKMFYPIAKYLDKKFGHRTLTHSIVFVLCTYIIIRSILPPPFPLIYLLGITSHLLFDMMTVQGVPLLYPFKKNPCVIPANPEARIRSGNTRAELTAFVLFIICGTFCYPLMANGFWMTFNKTLGSKKQLISEFKRSEKILLVEYEFRRSFELIKGVGYCLNANESKIIFLDTTSKKFVNLFSEDVPKTFTPHFSQFSSLNDISKEIKFNNISRFQLDSIIANAPILSYSIFSNKPIQLNDKSGQQFTDAFSNKIIINQEKEDNTRILKIKRIKLNQLVENHKIETKKYKEELQKIKQLKKEYITASDYRKSKIKQIIEQTNLKEPNKRALQNKLEILQEEIKFMDQESQQIKLFGTIKIITFLHL